MPRTRNKSLDERNQEIYRLYTEEKLSYEAIAKRYFMTISAIRNIVTMQRLYKEEK